MKDTDLTEVVDAQIAAFKAALPMANVYTYDLAAIPKEFTGPVILLESVNFRVDDKKSGHGNMLWIDVEFNAHCMMTRAQSNVAVEVQNLAALVLKIVNKNKWGLANIQLPNSLEAMPGKFTTGPGGFDSWVASWNQTIAIGDTWINKSFVPDSIFLSESPDIGQDNQPSYENLKDGYITAS